MMIPIILGVCSVLAYNASVKAQDKSLTCSYRNIQSLSSQAKVLAEVAFGLGLIPLFWGISGILVSVAVLGLNLIRRLI